MFYDLNLPCPSTANPKEVSRILAFCAELGYKCIALSRHLSGKVPTNISEHTITLPLPSTVTVPKSITLLTRITFTISDPSQNHRLTSLQSACNLIALRPTNDKALALCCQSLECDLISLDLSVRLPFILKFSSMAAALKRGVRFEICYSGGVLSSGTAEARRNLISGATALIRATRGRGIIVSSEARSVLGLRGPWDVVNLVAVWGLSQDRGKEAVCEEARKVVHLARLKRDSFRGVVEFVYGGQENDPIDRKGNSTVEGSNQLKRKASPDTPAGGKDDDEPLTKTQMKKRAKKARLEAAAMAAAEAESGAETAPPSQPLNVDIPHETQQSGKS